MDSECGGKEAKPNVTTSRVVSVVKMVVVFILANLMLLGWIAIAYMGTQSKKGKEYLKCLF